jgi:5-methylcytosine-specific restriction protein B
LLCVLVIDELNRANVPRALGELMFLLEYRSETIDLQFSQGFALPSNIAIIATMNTADRSIRSIDVALRRRFDIFECLPDASILHAFYDQGKGVNHIDGLVAGFEALNADLTTHLDKHHTIGQTFFMASEMTSAGLRRVWDRKVSPLIGEYFFDAPDLAHEFTIDRYWPSANAL